MAINKFNLLRNFVSKLETADNDGMGAMQAAILEAMDILEESDKASSGDDSGE